MPAPALVVTALLLWSLGASLYTWELWRARGLTDNGWVGLFTLMLGSSAMAWALAVEWPTLAVCALVPGYFALAIVVAKVRARLRVRWRQPVPGQPVMLPREPEPDDDVLIAPLDLRRWDRPDPEPEPDAALVTAEAERAARLTKMFG
jgi:hypothetical protein